MPHIHTQPGQHDTTASAMIVRYDGDSPYALLVRHKKYGRYIQPGGHVELHESPWGAILHEIEEETGYELSQLKILQPKDSLRSLEGDNQLHPSPAFLNTHRVANEHFHSDMMFIFTTRELPENSPDEGESQDLVWVDQRSITNYPDEDLFKDTKDMFLHAFTYYIGQWDELNLSVFSPESTYV